MAAIVQQDMARIMALMHIAIPIPVGIMQNIGRSSLKLPVVYFVMCTPRVMMAKYV